MLEVVEKARELELPTEDDLRRLAELADRLAAKDWGESHHGAVATLSAAIAAELRLPDEEVRHVELGALLHDVGKLSIPDRILRKRAPLTDLEWVQIRRHAVAGERLLLPLLALPDILAILRSHHERWDGTGYPDGLAGRRIPLGARIVAVADAFRAMVEPRPYRPPVDDAAALAELIRGAGRQFDPLCVDALRRVLEWQEHARRESVS